MSDGKERFEWQRGAEDDRYLWRQQFRTAIGETHGFNARLLIIGELLLDLLDTRIGRILVALAAVTLAWALI